MNKVLHFIDNRGRRHYKNISRNVMPGGIPPQQIMDDNLINTLLQHGNTCTELGFKKGTVLGRNYVSIQDIIVSIRMSQLTNRDYNSISECVRWSSDFNDDGVTSEDDVVTLSNIVLFYQSYGCTRETSTLYYCNIHDCENETPPEIHGFDGWGNNQTSTRTNVLPGHIVDPGGSCISRNTYNYRGCPPYSDVNELYSNVNWGCYDYNTYIRCDSCNIIDEDFEGFINYDCCYNYPSKEINGNEQPDWYFQYQLRYGVNDLNPDINNIGTLITDLKIDNEFINTMNTPYIGVYGLDVDVLPQFCCTSTDIFECDPLESVHKSNEIFNKIDCNNTEGHMWISDTPYDVPVIAIFKDYGGDSIDQYTGCLNDNGYIDCSNIVGILPRYKSNTWYVDNIDEDDFVNPTDLPPLKFQRDLAEIEDITFDDDIMDDYTGPDHGIRYPYVPTYDDEDIQNNNLTYIIPIELDSDIGGSPVVIRIWNPKDEQIYDGGCFTLSDGESIFGNYDINNPGLIEVNTDENVGIIGCPESSVNINGVDYNTCNYSSCSVGCSDENGYPIEGDISCCIYEVCDGVHPVTGLPFECVGVEDIQNYPWRWTYYQDCDGDELPCIDTSYSLCISDEDGIESLYCNGNQPLLGGICVTESGDQVSNWEHFENIYWSYQTTVSCDEKCENLGKTCIELDDVSDSYPSCSEENWYEFGDNDISTGYSLNYYDDSNLHHTQNPNSCHNYNTIGSTYINDLYCCCSGLENVILEDEGVGCDPTIPSEISTEYCTFMNNDLPSYCNPIVLESIGSCDCPNGMEDDCGVCGGDAIIGNGDYTSPYGTICNYDPHNSNNKLDCNCDCPEDYGDSPRCIDECGICRNNFDYNSNPYIIDCYLDLDGDGQSYYGADTHQCCPSGSINIGENTQLFCSELEPTCINNDGNTVYNICNECNDGICNNGYTSNVLPECTVFPLNESPYGFDGEGNQTIECESESCNSNLYECGSCITVDSILGCMKHTCGDNNDNCADSIYDLYREDECHIPGLNNTCMQIECDINSTPNINEGLNPCNECGNTNSKPGNPNWNTSCADCAGIPCLDGYAAHLCTNLNEELACEYFYNFDPHPSHWWGGELSYNCENKKDSTGNNCCNINDVDECGVCNGSLNIPGYTGKIRWWPDFDGDGMANGYPYDYENGGFCGIIAPHNGEYIGDLNLYLHPRTPPPYDNIPSDSYCLLSDDTPCYIKTCNQCTYYNSDNTTIFSNECNNIPLNWTDNGGTIRYLTCIDDINYSDDCTTNNIDNCELCCNPNYCMDIGGCGGSGLMCSDNNECDMIDGIPETCVFATVNDGDMGRCFIWNGVPSLYGGTGPNWDICTSQNGLDAAAGFNVMCDCKNQGCGCNYSLKIKYYWDLDNDDRYGIDGDFYYCEEQYPESLYNNPHDNQWDTEYDATAPDKDKCTLSNFSNYICCEHPYYCSIGELHGGCDTSNCNGCTIRSEIDGLLDSSYCGSIESGCNCLNLNLIPIGDDGDTVSDSTYYTIVSTESSVGVSIIKIKVDMEVPDDYVFDVIYDSYDDDTVLVSLWQRDIEITSDIVNVLTGSPVAEFHQQELDLSPGVYTLKSTYNGIHNSIDIYITDPIYGCTITETMCDDIPCDYCNSPNIIIQSPTHDTSCPQDDPNCPNDGSSCIKPMKYYIDPDGDGIPCNNQVDSYIWACPSYNEMQDVINNGNYPSFGIIGYSDQYPGCYYDPPSEYCKPPRPHQFFDNPTYGMIAPELTPINAHMPICADDGDASISAVAFCWDFNYNYPISNINWEWNTPPRQCKQWIGGSNFYEEGNWITNESYSILTQVECQGYGYILGTGTFFESGNYCDCPGNTFDDCGTCLYPECIDYNDCDTSTPDSDLSCHGNILLDNPCSNGEVPSNRLWNSSCTGCTDPTAINYSENNTLPCSGYSNTCMGECEDPDEISPNKKLKCSTDSDCVHNGNNYGSCLYTYPTDSGLTLEFYSNPGLNNLDGIDENNIENVNNNCNEYSSIYHSNESITNFCLNNEYDEAIVNCEEMEVSVDTFVWNVTSPDSVECIESSTGCSPNTYYIQCKNTTFDDSSLGPNCCCKYNRGCNDPVAPNYQIGCDSYGCENDCEGEPLSDCMFNDPMRIGTLDYDISNSYSIDVLGLFISTSLLESGYIHFIINRYIKINDEVIYITDISNQINHNNSYSTLILSVSRGMFNTTIGSHNLGDSIYLDDDQCNYNYCCVDYVTRGCTDDNAINYYCNDLNRIGYINEQLCPDTNNNGIGNLPNGGGIDPQTGHIKVESCSQSINESCGGQYRYLPAPGTNKINMVNGPIYVDGPNDASFQIGEEEFKLASTWQGFPTWNNSNGTIVNDDNVHWNFTGWNNNFNQRFGDGNWVSYIVDIDDSPVPGLTKALKVQIYDYDDMHDVSGWGGLWYSINNGNTSDNNYFSSWVKVIDGQFQFGHLNTNNRIRVNSTNNEWKLIHSKHESQVTYNVDTSQTENGVHVYADARNGNRTAEFYILLLHITDEWEESLDDNCCCEYKYDCNNSKIMSSDVTSVFPNIVYIENSVSYYDNCGICSGGTSDHDANVDQRGCGCFKGQPPTWYYDLDCPIGSLNDDGTCNSNGESDGYGCPNIIMEYTGNEPIWQYCLPDQGGEIPDYYIHPSTFPSDGWSDLGWINYEQEDVLCYCALNTYDCSGNCTVSYENYYGSCDITELEDNVLCTNNDGECGGCDNCGICKGPNRDSNTCQLDDGCEEEWLWPSVSNPGVSCNWYPGLGDESIFWRIFLYGGWPFHLGLTLVGWLSAPLNESNFDCNCDCDGDAYIDSCGYCVGGNTDRTPDFAKDDCGICNGNNWISTEETDLTPNKAFNSNASGEIIDNLYCNFKLSSSNMGCDCSCPSDNTPELDICGFCGGDGNTCRGCTEPQAFNNGLQDCGDNVNGASYLFCDECKWQGYDSVGDGSITINNECLYGNGDCIDCAGEIFDLAQYPHTFRRLDPFGMCCTHGTYEWQDYVFNNINSVNTVSCNTSCSTCNYGYEMNVEGDGCGSTGGCDQGDNYCDNKSCSCQGYGIAGHYLMEVDTISKLYSSYSDNINYDSVTSYWKWESEGCGEDGGQNTPLRNNLCTDYLGTETDDYNAPNGGTCKDCYYWDCVYACTACQFGNDNTCEYYNNTNRYQYWNEGNCKAFNDPCDFTSEELLFVHEDSVNPPTSSPYSNFNCDIPHFYWETNDNSGGSPDAGGGDDGDVNCPFDWDIGYGFNVPHMDYIDGSNHFISVANGSGSVEFTGEETAKQFCIALGYEDFETYDVGDVVESDGIGIYDILTSSWTILYVAGARRMINLVCDCEF